MQNAATSPGKSRVAVVGDAFLDDYYFVTSDRRSEEAPIPIYTTDLSHAQRVPGGAANVAQSLYAMEGVRPCLFLPADDPNPFGFCAFETICIPWAFRSIGTKSRYFLGTQQVFRVDAEPVGHIPEGVLGVLISSIASFMPHFIVISDYGKGVCSQSLLRRLRLATYEGATIVVDAKHPYSSFEGAHTVKINQAAANRWAGATSDRSLLDISRTLRSKFHIANLIITLGSHGAMINDDHVDCPGRTLPPPPSTTGAGDCFVATYAASLARGILPKQAAAEAVYLAYYACQSSKLTVHA